MVRIKSNPYLQEVVDLYSLDGLSFREFLELETGKKFPICSFKDILEHHEELVGDVLHEIRPLAYFSNYLEYKFDFGV